MPIETIAGLQVQVPTSKRGGRVRRHVAALADMLRLKAVDVPPVCRGDTWITYHLADHHVAVSCHLAITPRMIAQAVEARKSSIRRIDEKMAHPRVIDVADACLARSLPSAHDALTSLVQADEKPTIMHIWGSSGVMFSPGVTAVKIDDFLEYRLEQERAWISHHSDLETWSKGNLITGRKVQLPSTLLNALKGRMLDEVVTGTMLAGGGLIIRKAWMTGGRLGLNFEKRDLPLGDVLRDMRTLPKAA